jgi:PD-(D/E)XK nuclease superfamily protein
VERKLDEARSLDSNRKGAIAEAEIAAAAVHLAIPILKPVAEHGRYDLGLEIGDRILRVQCKWGRLDKKGRVTIVHLATSTLRPRGYVCTTYTADEIDLVGIYCGAVDRCYLLPISLVAGRSVLHLRLAPPANGQRACITLAEQFEFEGAVAQLEERLSGTQEAGGSSPPSSIASSLLRSWRVCENDTQT